MGDDWKFKGKGANSSGDSFGAAPNIDHTAEVVKSGLSEWLRWLRSDIGFDGWRCVVHTGIPIILRHLSFFCILYHSYLYSCTDCYSRCPGNLQIVSCQILWISSGARLLVLHLNVIWTGISSSLCFCVALRPRLSLQCH